MEGPGAKVREGTEQLSGRAPEAQSKVTEGQLDRGEKISLILFVSGEKINITKLLMLSVRGQRVSVYKEEQIFCGRISLKYVNLRLLKRKRYVVIWRIAAM